MLHARMLPIILVLCALGACSKRTDASPPGMTSPSAGSGAEPGADDGPANDADEPREVQDRCLSSGCEKSLLPLQPELEFLEDMGDGWQRLMEADWHMAAESEGYRCMTLTIPRDIYITAFAPQSPQGTHHATFGVSARVTEPDSVFPCAVGQPGERRLQGSGAGSEPSELPPGVAMRLRRGEQVYMNLHLFNVGDEPLTGRSGMWVKTAAPDEVEYESEAVLAGPLTLDIPVGRSTQRGGCTLRADATIYAIGPHMHQSGVHLRATVQTGGDRVVLHDGPYDFTHQVVYPVDDVRVHEGDRIEIECTYENATDRTLHWGDSSLDEMCFVGLSLYPAIGYGSFPCAN